MSVIEEIRAERRRQIDGEGYSQEHDDLEHRHGDLCLAAAAYAVPDYWRWNGRRVRELLWPWEPGPKFKDHRRRELIKAAALLVAEIERMDRLVPVTPPADSLTQEEP